LPVVAVACQKGGVGKTTTTFNLSAAIIALNRSQTVLAIDFDPQAHLTRAYNLRNHAPTIVDALNESLAGRALSGWIHTTPWNVDVGIASSDLAGAEAVFLQDPVEQHYHLKTLLEPIRERYDVVLVDCPPALSCLTLNALTAADYVLAVYEPTVLAVDGLQRLEETVHKVKTRLNPGLKWLGLLANRVDTRTVHGSSVLQSVRRHYDGRLPVFDQVVRQAVTVQESVAASTPVIFYESRYASHQAIQAAYLALAKECIERMSA
jgi:chromosome partitioning protein